MKPFASRFPGTCPECGQRYPKGTLLVKRASQWVHETCPAAAPKDGPAITHTAFASTIPTYDPDEPRPARRSVQQNISELYGGHPPQGSFDNRPLTGRSLMTAISASERSEPEPEDVQPAKPFIPSRYQQDLFTEIEHPTARHIVMKAGPGSGKTTTATKALELTPKDAAVAFVAFNKRIVEDIVPRVPKRITVSTLHSMGMSVLTHTFQRVRVEKDKVGWLLDPIYPASKAACPDQHQRSVNRVKRQAMRKIVSLAKATLVPAHDPNAVMEMIDRYNVEVPEDYVDELVNLLPEVMQLCLTQTDVIDFDDMIWMPVVLKDANFFRYDYLFVDEAQDLNTSQIEFIQKAVKPEGRIICVGDAHQSMYAFRGADAEAIPNLIRLLTAKVMPLTISYRNPVSHVRLTNSVVTDNDALVEARPDAPEGVIADLPYDALVGKVEAGDMVICRTNAPLIEPAFACIRAGKKASIAGREIGEDLIKLVENFNVDTLDALQTSLNEYYEHEYQKLLDRGKELQAAILDDKVKTLMFVMDNSRNVAHLVSQLRMLFSDDNVGVVFSSVHRAKGLEAERVFILKPELMPFPKAKSEWELEQEKNIQYVAYSRSKSELYFVRGGR